MITEYPGHIDPEIFRDHGIRDPVAPFGAPGAGAGPGERGLDRGNRGRRPGKPQFQ